MKRLVGASRLLRLQVCASIVCSALLSLTVVLWVRSYFAFDCVSVAHGWTTPPAGDLGPNWNTTEKGLTSNRGRLVAQTSQDVHDMAADEAHEGEDGYHLHWFRSHADPSWPSSRHPSLFFRLGFWALQESGRDPHGHGSSESAVWAVPYWLLAAMCAAGLGLSRRYATRPITATRRCANCGYDLRASPERCPECGRRSALS